MTTTITRAQLAQLFETGQPITVEQTGLVVTPRPQIDMDWLLILVADVIQWPVREIELVDSVGRFCLVDYTPVEGYDPDIMVFYGSGTAADRFHETIRTFQKMRRDRPLYLQNWFKNMQKHAKNVIAPALYALKPEVDEATFVMKWARLVAAKARRISDH